jgi:hypothetical protein
MRRWQSKCPSLQINRRRTANCRNRTNQNRSNMELIKGRTEQNHFATSNLSKIKLVKSRTDQNRFTTSNLSKIELIRSRQTFQNRNMQRTCEANTFFLMGKISPLLSLIYKFVLPPHLKYKAATDHSRPTALTTHHRNHSPTALTPQHFCATFVL